MLTPDRPRVLGLVEGDPRVALTGIGHHLLEALGGQLPVVGTLDFAPRGAERLALAMATFRPDRAAWRARFHTSRLAHRVLSRTLARRLAHSDLEFDVALQVFGWVSGQPRPYALYLDQTRLMAERGWPEWMPLGGGERREILERETAMYAAARHIFTMGRPARESLISDYGIEAGRVTPVGGGLKFGEVRHSADPAREPAILFVGKDFDRKGGGCLLAAFDLVRREVPEATLHLVGVERRFEQPGVVNHGRVFSGEQLERLYAGARAFTLPSRYEPYGLVLVEAMAHGIPCVGTQVESIPEILDHGRAGVLVPPNDPEALAGALLRLLGDYDLAHSIGAAGRTRVEAELTWDHVAGRIAPTLSRVLGGT